MWSGTSVKSITDFWERFSGCKSALATWQGRIEVEGIGFITFFKLSTGLYFRLYNQTGKY